MLEKSNGGRKPAIRKPLNQFYLVLQRAAPIDNASSMMTLPHNWALSALNPVI
jgi:hypothetical protein